MSRTEREEVVVTTTGTRTASPTLDEVALLAGGVRTLSRPCGTEWSAPQEAVK